MTDWIRLLDVRYGADIALPGMLHGKILRSPHAHARIVRIDTSKATALPGVRAVVTGADLSIIHDQLIDLGETLGNPRMLAENLLAATKVLNVGHAVAAATSPATSRVNGVTSPSPMLGRTLLYTALTRARELAIIVGQRTALSLAARDWRRVPRQTTLGGLLSGTLRFAWPHGSATRGADDQPMDMWAGLVEGGGETGGAAPD